MMFAQEGGNGDEVLFCRRDVWHEGNSWEYWNFAVFCPVMQLGEVVEDQSVVGATVLSVKLGVGELEVVVDEVEVGVEKLVKGAPRKGSAGLEQYVDAALAQDSGQLAGVIQI